MQRPSRGERHAIRADRLAVGEVDGDRDMGVAIRGIENAGGLVRDQGAVGKRAFGRNVALGDRPPLASDWLHGPPPFFSLATITPTLRLSLRGEGNFSRLR